MATIRENDPLTERIIGLAIEVHRQLGPGLLESVYEECLHLELLQSGLFLQRQVPLPIVYRSIRLECGYRLDMIVEKQVIVEIKAVERLLPVHEAQMLTYMKLSGVGVGLLLNFNTPVLKDGIRRLINKK